jgi:dTDP-4-dehydrorhamnose reductase
MKKILVYGRIGQVGWELRRTLATLGQVIALDREDVDMTNSDALIKSVREHSPDIIVNAAAYTAVDKAETDYDLAMALNGKAPGVLAEEAKRLKAILVHYSTDYVYDGQSKLAYSETHVTRPLNAYGKTKLAGDEAIQAVGGSHLIFRTSWVYGARGHNFMLTMLRLAKEKEQLKIVADQIGAPTWSRMIAQSTSQVLSQCVTQPDESKWGIYHLSSGGETSWCGFAEKIFKNAECRPGFRSPKVLPIPSSEYPLPAQRPQNSLLCNNKFWKAFGLKMPDWDVALELCMAEME